jgi:ribonuclease Z
MTQKTKITFLGTSGAIPSAKRNSTSILLNYNEENILIDCGEGTQRQIRKAHLNPCKVNRILITHWHGDHVLGISGLLQTLALSGYNKIMHIYGPIGTKKYIQEMMKTFMFAGEKYEIKVEEVSGNFFETNDFYLKAEKMQHGIPTNAYSFVIKDKIRINKKKLAKTKISGPILKDLKKGKDIIYKNKKYKAKDLIYLEKGKKISFVLDTRMNKMIIPFIKNADLFICESTFSKELKEKAKEYLHMTSEDAANVAKKAKVGKLILTHISARYEKNMKLILDEAKKIFKNSYLAKDLDVLEI